MGQVVKPRTGEFALDGKCLVIRNILEGDVPNDTLLFWPETYGLNVQDGAVEVLDATDRVVARVGDAIQVNAFNVTYSQATKHGGLDKITPACSGGIGRWKRFSRTIRPHEGKTQTGFNRLDPRAVPGCVIPTTARAIVKIRYNSLAIHPDRRATARHHPGRGIDRRLRWRAGAG